MTSVLLVQDEYSTAKGGISTINRQVAVLLAHLGLNVYCTVLTATDKEKDDAKREHVTLLFPQCDKDDRREPSPSWLYDHRSRYPDLPSDIGFVIGHVLVSSRAAVRIKEERLPQAKLYLFTHVLPEDTEHYKGEGKALDIEEKMRLILEVAEKADALFSVGPTIYDYYQNQYRVLQDPFKPHYLFLPKPSDIFIDTCLRYVETKTKVVLSIGRVSGVERLKGYDLAAMAMSTVAEKLPWVKWQVRGISRDDFQTSKEVIDSNIHSGTFHFTPLEYGTQDQICRDMKQAHLVLIPSRSEPFGLVGLEAIAAGIPVLVSNRSGIADFMQNIVPEFGLSIFSLRGNDVEDSRNLANKIAAMLQNGRREFELAKQFKDKLLGSRYWEESHEKLGQACGAAEGKGATRTLGATAEIEDIPAHNQQSPVDGTQGKERDQTSSKRTDEEDNTLRSAASTNYKSTLGTLKPLPWDDRFSLDLDQIFTSLVLLKNRASHSTSYFSTSTLEPDLLSEFELKSSESDSDSEFSSEFDSDSEFISESDQFFSGEQRQFPHHQDSRILQSLDDLFDQKTVQDLVGRFNILVVGDAGSGKSTLLSKVALDWSRGKGRLAEMNKIVLLVRLREVQPGESIAEIVWDQCVTKSAKGISISFIQTCLQDNESKLVFLLDGYDELVSGAGAYKQAVPELLVKKWYPNSTVIVTSRPHTGIERYMAVDCSVQVYGFSPTHVDRFVTRYFETVGKPSLADSLVKALQANIVARSMIQTPMFLMLICVLWEEDPTRVFPGTMSGLYQELLLCVIRKYCVREGLAMPDDEVPSEVSCALLHLGRLALESLLRGESLVDLGKSADMKNTDILLKLGIVSKEVSASRLHPREQWNFPHKTMQEFIAARYVADSVNTSSGNLHNLVPLDTLDAALQQSNLVQFICGCGGKVASEILTKLNTLQEPEHMSGTKSQEDKLQPWNEDKNAPLKNLCMMSLYEGQDSRLFPILSKLLSSLDLKINVPSKESAALKYYLHHVPALSEGRVLRLTVHEDSEGDAVEYLSGLVEKPLPDLQLHLAEVEENLIPFLTNIPNIWCLNFMQASLKELYFSVNQIGDVGLKGLAGVLHHLSCLEKLDLSRNNIGDKDMEPFTAIQGPVASLKELYLSGNKLGDVCLRSLSSVLHYLPSLEKLHLQDNNIGDKDMEPFAPIQGPAVRLKEINLSGNKIGDVCLRSLAGVLHHLPCLEELNLCAMFTDTLHRPCYQFLQVVTLGINSITVVGIKEFAEAIQGMPALKRLFLHPRRPVHLDDSAAMSITTMLTRLPLLTELQLTNISMEAAGFQAMATAVEEHSTLQCIGYSGRLCPLDVNLEAVSFKFK